MTIFKFCAKNDTEIQTVWIPREQNTQVDETYLKANTHNSTVVISLQVELLPASNFNHVSHMTKCEFLIKSAAPTSLVSVKISYADSFSNKSTCLKLQMFNFQKHQFLYAILFVINVQIAIPV